MTSEPRLFRRFARAPLQILFIISLAITALLFAWQSLRMVDFAYPLLYDTLSIGEHIDHWAPQNRYRRGFETTTREQRLGLFAAISEAVHHQGAGLASLQYRDDRGRTHQLLRQPEIIHLRSVARLIDGLFIAGYVALGGLLISIAMMRATGTPVPRLSRVFLWAGAVTAAATVLTLAIGPTRVFYTAHTWVFPPGEQWYFTYPESLMTTLMKAPDLFGGIAVLLVAATLIWFALLMAAARRLTGTARG